VVCSAAIVLASSARPAAAQVQAPEVVDVSFEGNASFPSDSLARAIVTRETTCRSWVLSLFCGLGWFENRALLRERELTRDRARLIVWYRRRGFLNAQVDSARVQRTRTEARVSFLVEEGAPVLADSIAFEGLEEVDIEDLIEDLPIREGDRLNTIALDATRDTIIRRMADRGYAYAEVLRSAIRPAEDPLHAVVTFQIVPGPATTYGDITVDGTRDLSVTTVLRTTQLSTGEPYSRREVEEARSRLYGLEIIRNATVVPDTLTFSLDPEVDVAVTVQEGDPYRVRAGAGWSNAECITAEARWTARNFLGGGRFFQVRGRLGNILAPDFRDVLCQQSGDSIYADLTGLASVDFVQPWIFSTRNALSASLFIERQSLPDIFVRRAVGLQLGLSRTIAPQTVLTGFYRPALTRLRADAVLFCTGFLVCSPDDVAELEGSNWLSPVGLNVSRDRTDDLLDPSSGYRLLFDVEHARQWTGSDFSYDRIVAEGSRYTPIGRWVFATRLRGGWVVPGGFERSAGSDVDIVHPEKRFYSGGANSVRGFAQSRLGPRVLFAPAEGLLTGTGACTPAELSLLQCMPGAEAELDPRPIGGTRLVEANAEFRIPIGSLLQGVVFVDAGQAWSAGQPLHLEFTPGVGVRVPSPVGPIRLDVAYRFRGGQELPVVTEEIRPFDSLRDTDDDQIEIDGIPIPWVRTGNLVTLGNPFLFGTNDSGVQIHISIGQAF
jgi:outer membrane protein assembly factor BamA